MAETVDHPTQILLGHARSFVAQYTNDSMPAAEELLLDQLAGERLYWIYHRATVEGEPDIPTQLSLGAPAWGAWAIRKCFWRRPEPGVTLEVDWSRHGAVRRSPPLILSPGPDAHPVLFPHLPIMRIEVHLIRLFRAELDEMLRRVGLVPPLPAFPPPSPSPPPPPAPERNKLSAPLHEGTERWVYDEMEKDPPRRGDRKYVDRLCVGSIKA